jgi:hypothetical protein
LLSKSEREEQVLTNSAKPLFQVLLLDNDAGQDVSVHESEHVDFCVVKEHLQNGGSVFITSKEAQKVQYPKTEAQTNYVKARRRVGFLFRQNLRS